MHSERTKLYGVLPVLRAIGLKRLEISRNTHLNTYLESFFKLKSVLVKSAHRGANSFLEELIPTEMKATMKVAELLPLKVYLSYFPWKCTCTHSP